MESRLKVEVGAPNFPVYLRWSKMSLGHQVFFLLAFVACTVKVLIFDLGFLFFNVFAGYGFYYADDSVPGC